MHMQRDLQVTEWSFGSHILAVSKKIMVAANTSFAFSVVNIWTCWYSYSEHLVTNSNLQSELVIRV